MSYFKETLLTGKTGNNKNYEVGVDRQGHLETAIHSPLTAFGEVLTAELTPIAQVTFVYGINTDVVITGSNGSAYVTGSDYTFAKLGTGAAINQSASLATKRAIKYYTGQGTMARFTTVYSSPAVGSMQTMGLYDAEDGLAFGYSGSSFGVFRWFTGSLVEFVTQSSWNIDTLDGSGNDNNKSGMLLNPQTGNVYQINMQYLGFGNLVFSIEDPEEGLIQPVHAIKYPNAYTMTNLSNPTLPITATVLNTTNNSDIVLKTPSLAGFVEGKRVLTGPVNSHQNSITLTTEQSIFTIQNKTSFNGRTNKIRVFLRRLSLATDANSGAVNFRIVLNATLNPAGVYTSLSSNSVIETAPSGSTVSGGRTIAQFGLSARTSMAEDLTPFEIELAPGDNITIAATATVSNTVSATLSWIEDF